MKYNLLLFTFQHKTFIDYSSVILNNDLYNHLSSYTAVVVGRSLFLGEIVHVKSIGLSDTIQVLISLLFSTHFLSLDPLSNTNKYIIIIIISCVFFRAD